MATAKAAKRRRYELDINMRRQIPMGRRSLQIVLVVADCGRTGISATEVAEALILDRRVLHVFARRLRLMGLINSELVLDSESRTGRTVIYTVTRDGAALASAWHQFLIRIGQGLARRLRLE